MPQLPADFVTGLNIAGTFVMLFAQDETVWAAPDQADGGFISLFDQLVGLRGMTTFKY